MSTVLVVTITAGEAATILGIGKETVRRWCRAGYLAAEALGPGRRQGWRIRVDLNGRPIVASGGDK